MQVANASEYALAASLFSDNLEYICRFQKDRWTGTTHVNHGTVTDCCMPSGGAKNSGVGPFSKGPTNKDFFTAYRINYLKLACCRPGDFRLLTRGEAGRGTQFPGFFFRLGMPSVLHGAAPVKS